MEAKKLKTFADLLAVWQVDERQELVNGEIIKRPMARFEHGSIQSDIVSELVPYKKDKGPGGWWIATEINVRYSDHQCPTHDLAGWKKGRVPEKPSGIMEIAPDWVCEITSPGHEKKDYLDIFVLLQNNLVPYYWIISPEDQTLIAYKLSNKKYSVIETIEKKLGKVRIEPFIDIEFDLNDVLGG
jgi:Uma2 family endonuclease